MAENSIENVREILKIKKEILKEEKENLDSFSSAGEEKLKLIKEDDKSRKTKVEPKRLKTTFDSKVNRKEEPILSPKNVEKNGNMKIDGEESHYQSREAIEDPSTPYKMIRQYDQQFKFDTYKKYPSRYDESKQVGCLLFHKPNPTNAQVECEKSILLSKKEIQRHYAIEAMMIAEERRTSKYIIEVIVKRVNQGHISSSVSIGLKNTDIPASTSKLCKDQTPPENNMDQVENARAEARSTVTANSPTHDNVEGDVAKLEVDVSKVSLQEKEKNEHYKKMKAIRIQQYINEMEQQKHMRGHMVYQQPNGVYNYAVGNWYNNRFKNIHFDKYQQPYHVPYTAHVPYRAPIATEWKFYNQSNVESM